MLIINFSHPLTNLQLKKIESLTGSKVDFVYDIFVQFDPETEFSLQIEKLMDNFSLDSKVLQTEPILVNMPSLNYITAVLLTWLHGKMGYFPAIIRLKRQSDHMPPVFEVAEIINLQTLRDHARELR